MLSNVDFSGLGADPKPKKNPDPFPTQPVAPPPPTYESPSSLPKYSPAIAAGIGVMAVIAILITAKSKD